ncbi:LytR/AlgR family response regulator transcription factor [Terrisporobacter mayombei]|uniref:Stage 0 sporulation protein A homolog n=1 Tax=Terrisporobacter mayombei TaxID=1541 RepID=A0ABY9Q1S9_9FIRM|nr:LytTR family DNA-binding domain-containing protein [Terrisporobacter mayombei]MCC3867656.1 LytTR family DNA-binding domain-containing protein [Terrisporobacter mayombei]WMT81918.1 Transcriptional regulatory protein YpdB [Terrisporobacter mayombei]
MIKIAICDDDVIILNHTKEIIESYKIKDLQIYSYKNGEELLESEETFDIIFLDIDMNGINGIETAKKIRIYDKKVKIIYVTNYTDYTYSAFSVHAFGYLIKPIKEKNLHEQLDEALSYMKEDEECLIDFITEGELVRVDIKKIYYFEYISRKILMKTSEKTYIIRDKISAISDKMKDLGFEMPHKSFVVNLYNVKSIKGYDIYMMDESIIPLSQKKSSEFRNALNIYLSNHIEKQIRG